MKYLAPILLFISIAFSSCNSKNGNPNIIQKDEQELEYPVKVQEIEYSGMKYMITSGRSGESGVHVQNITLDSLNVAYMRRLLNK